MHHIHVKSSTIFSIGYDRPSLTLQITFKGKEEKPVSTYQYANVPPETVADVIFSDSVGSTFGKRIKGNEAFPFTKLETIEVPAVKEKVA